MHNARMKTTKDPKKPVKQSANNRNKLDAVERIEKLARALTPLVKELRGLVRALTIGVLVLNPGSTHQSQHPESIRPYHPLVAQVPVSVTPGLCIQTRVCVDACSGESQVVCPDLGDTLSMDHGASRGTTALGGH